MALQAKQWLGCIQNHVTLGMPTIFLQRPNLREKKTVKILLRTHESTFLSSKWQKLILIVSSLFSLQV